MQLKTTVNAVCNVHRTLKLEMIEERKKSIFGIEGSKTKSVCTVTVCMFAVRNARKCSTVHGRFRYVEGCRIERNAPAFTLCFAFLIRRTNYIRDECSFSCWCSLDVGVLVSGVCFGMGWYSYLVIN